MVRRIGYSNMKNEAIEQDIKNEKEWRRYLMTEIKAYRAELVCFKTEQIKQGKSIATLKVKSGVWGIVGGAIPTSIIMVWASIKSKTILGG